MVRTLYGCLLVLMLCSAYAQTSTPEAPAEHASSLTVIIFVVLFAGSCLGYIGYAWWGGRKKKK